MTNEAVIKLRRSDPIDFACPDANAYEKGQVVFLSSLRTISGSISTTADVAAAGIVAREKIANSGRTKVAVFRDGNFDVKLDAGGCSIGSMLKISGSNIFGIAKDTDYEAGKVFGQALGAGAASATVEMAMNI